MPLHIIDVTNGSPADKLGIKKDAKLISINKIHLEDILDYYYHIENNNLEIAFQNKNSEPTTVYYNNNHDQAFGLEFEAPECKQCINNCVFCFVDQMPENMRSSLYIKDDDFVFSFLYGNFVTLTNLTEHYLNKIINEKISPLYVSVHTTNPLLHKQMMRYNRDFNIIETLKLLGEHNIELHTQLVLVPDYNDKNELRRSLIDLTSPNLNVSSIGIVPVGLTRFRDNLSNLRAFTKEECQEIYKIAEEIKSESDFPYLFCSDEIFLNAGIAIPDTDYYNEFEQIENGIGMVRMLWDNWAYNKEDFIKEIEQINKNIQFITSSSGEKALKPLVDELQKAIPTLNFRITKVLNDFFGHSVTVAGLLTWQDVKKQISLDKDELVAFSSNFFNYENKTLDNITEEEIAQYLGSSYLIINELFESWELK